MASEIYLTRTLSGLAAADDASRDLLRKFKLGTVVLVDIRNPRNIRFHRKFFALLNIVWTAAGDWPKVEDLLRDLKVHIGHVEKHDLVVRSSGEVLSYVVPKSIAFSRMNNDQFETFYERALIGLCELAGGIPEEALRTEVLERLAEA